VYLTIAGLCVFFYVNTYENIKHLTPDIKLLNNEIIERYTQAAINLVLNGVLA
jgi:TetR/AcrR family transcriptional regulator